MRSLTIPALLALALAACDGDEPPTYCVLPNVSVGTPASGPLELSIAPQPAVVVLVQDSVTGADLVPGATGAFVVGNFADSLRHQFNGPLVAWGPAGRYSLVVQHPGYATWGTDQVRVTAETCGPHTETVTARLQRLGGG